MKAAIIIPARYASTRFPGKPMIPIAGRSLIERVYRRAVSSSAASAIYVATDDDRILHHVEAFGGSVVMTVGNAATGTDRVAMALAAIEKRGGETYDQVINIQGDEPLIDMESVDRMIQTLQSEPVDLVTLACPLREADEFTSPDVVKVVCDRSGNAIYFSRAPIPHGGASVALRHIGIYGFQAEALRGFASLSPSSLERVERLEQLRALENGYTIRVLKTAVPHLGVDRPEDVARVEAELAKLDQTEK